jgi:hypothetical protein
LGTLEEEIHDRLKAKLELAAVALESAELTSTDKGPTDAERNQADLLSELKPVMEE